MSKSTKRATPDSADAEPAFEKTMARLEAIVEEMECGELELEKLISAYEEGTKLVEACQQKLAQAELKIQQLERGPSGDLALKSASIDTPSE